MESENTDFSKVEKLRQVPSALDMFETEFPISKRNTLKTPEYLRRHKRKMIKKFPYTFVYVKEPYTREKEEEFIANGGIVIY